MEQRRALAWAGSITLAVGASVIVLGSLVGGFGLGPPPAHQAELPRAGVTPGGSTPGPVPETSDTGSAPEGTDSPPPGSDSPPAAGGPAAEPAAEGSGAKPAPRVAITKPASGGAAARRAPGRPLRQQATIATVPGLGGTPGGRDHRNDGSGQVSGAGTVPTVATSPVWRVRLIAAVLGQRPGDDSNPGTPGTTRATIECVVNSTLPTVTVRNDVGHVEFTTHQPGATPEGLPALTDKTAARDGRSGSDG